MKGLLLRKPISDKKSATKKPVMPPNMNTSPWAKLIMQQHAVDQRVAQRDQRIHAPLGDAEDEQVTPLGAVQFALREGGEDADRHADHDGHPQGPQDDADRGEARWPSHENRILRGWVARNRVRLEGKPISRSLRSVPGGRKRAGGPESGPPALGFRGQKVIGYCDRVV